MSLTHFITVVDILFFLFSEIYCNYIIYIYQLQCVSVKIQINIVSEYLLKIVDICKRESAVVVCIWKQKTNVALKSV